VRTDLSRQTFLRGAAGLCGAALLGASPGTAVEVTIAAIPSDIAGEAYYAEEAGFFKKAGLSAKILGLTNGAAISAAVAGGSAAIGYSNVVSLAIAHERGLPFTILAPANLHVHDAPTAGLLAVKKSSPIANAKDLRGKVVAVIGLNNIAHLATRLWIDKNGGDSSAVRFIEMAFSEMPTAVAAGRVDAASLDAIADPNLGKPDDPLRILASTFDAVSPRFAPSVWFSTTGWVGQHEEAARAFVAAMRETARWANAHHAESARILGQHTHQTVAAIEASTRSTFGERLTPELIQPDIVVAARYGVVKSAFTAAQLVSGVAAA
jgi:NitT/TauT family transport system substrate-binding protein